MIINKSNIDKYIQGTELHCTSRGITSIEDIPDHITHIYCYNNKLTSLPKLPSCLTTLHCYSNQLTSLPYLPIGLIRLFCGNNKLTNYPDGGSKKLWMIEHNNQLKLANRVNIINKINDHK